MLEGSRFWGSQNSRDNKLIRIPDFTFVICRLEYSILKKYTSRHAGLSISFLHPAKESVCHIKHILISQTCRNKIKWGGSFFDTRLACGNTEVWCVPKCNDFIVLCCKKYRGIMSQHAINRVERL